MKIRLLSVVCVACVLFAMSLSAQCPNDANVLAGFRNCCSCGQAFVSFCGGIGGTGCDPFGGVLFPCCHGCGLQQGASCQPSLRIKSEVIQLLPQAITRSNGTNSCSASFQSWMKEKIKEQRDVVAELRQDKLAVR
jgi:hypothetical protein